MSLLKETKSLLKSLPVYFLPNSTYVTTEKDQVITEVITRIFFTKEHICHC